MFDDKIALVTGAASGIGAATARMFANEGAAVVLGDKLGDVKSVADELIAGGASAISLTGDVSDPEYCWQLSETAMNSFGRLDFAFNNAGIRGKPCDVEDLQAEDWSRVIDVNLNAVFFCIKHQIPAMLQGDGGVIVNNSSVLGLKPIPGQSLEYTAAKHGVIGMTRQVAVNYGGRGIRCVAVCPGFIETPLTKQNGESNTGHEGADWFIDRTPLARSGQPEDIAGVVRMLCSDDASYVNGASLQVDGGFVLT